MSQTKKQHIQPASILHVAEITAKRRILIGIPLTGLVRAEWMIARYGQIIPCNWSQVDCVHWMDQYSPIGFLVADARNVIATKFVESDCEWLLFIDHDVILPRDFILKANDRMLEEKVPIWGGLYFTKSVPSEPLIYRGNGNSYYTGWKMGDEVWVSGMGLGCHMIHKSVMRVMYETSEEYMIGTFKGRRIFETPSKIYEDPESHQWWATSGTEDLHFYGRIMREGVLEKAGWPKIAKKEFPFLCDTSIFCYHIDFSGQAFPSRNEQGYFIEKANKAKKRG